jgi:membrane AbrB-like protein
MIDTLVVLAVGLAGGLVGYRLRIPGGSLLGAMSAVGAVQLSRVTPLRIDSTWAILGQVLVGAVIGSTMDRRMLSSFRKVLVPGVLAVASMAAAGVLVGTTFAVLGFADPLTALFGLAPGGFAEMTAAAIALGANGPLVATIHVVRVVAVIVLLPLILRPVARWTVRRDIASGRRPVGGEIE